jgi:hypothetical protein
MGRQSSQSVNCMQNVGCWPRLPRKANKAPLKGSSSSTCWASIATLLRVLSRPSMPLRISVRPHASQTRAPDGRTIIRAAPPVHGARHADRSRRRREPSCHRAMRSRSGWAVEKAVQPAGADCLVTAQHASHMTLLRPAQNVRGQAAPPATPFARHKASRCRCRIAAQPRLAMHPAPGSQPLSPASVRSTTDAAVHCG